MLGGDGWDIEKDARGHGIMLHSPVRHGEWNGAQDVTRVLWSHVVQVREVPAAEVADVETLQGHVEELVSVAVWSSIRPAQKLLYEAPAMQ